MSDAEPSVNPSVDVVIVIDTSASMKDEAAALSHAAEAAIAAAQVSCPADVRVEWLGMEGTWRGTHFTRTIREYLTQTCQVPEAMLRGRKRGEIEGGGAQEDGARAIEDVATHFDWRPGSKRAVFYLGDEALEGGGNQVEPEDIEAANRAIDAAKAAGVTVHTYFGTTRSRHKEALQQEYARVAHETGGQAFTEQDTLEAFTEVLEKVICTTRNRVDEGPATPTPPEQAQDHIDQAAGAPALEPAQHPQPAVLVPPADEGPATPAPPEQAQDHIDQAASAPVPTLEPAQHPQPAVLAPPAQVTRRTQALDVVKNHMIAALAIGTLPLPLIDIAALTALQFRMIARLSQLYDVHFSQHFVRAVITSLLGGIIPATAPRWGWYLLKFLPLPGLSLVAIASTTTAGAATYAVGRVFMQRFEQGKSFSTLQVEDIREDIRRFMREGQAVVSNAPSGHM